MCVCMYVHIYTLSLNLIPANCSCGVPGCYSFVCRWWFSEVFLGWLAWMYCTGRLMEVKRVPEFQMSLYQCFQCASCGWPRCRPTLGPCCPSHNLQSCNAWGLERHRQSASPGFQHYPCQQRFFQLLWIWNYWLKQWIPYIYCYFLLRNVLKCLRFPFTVFHNMVNC